MSEVESVDEGPPQDEDPVAEETGAWAFQASTRAAYVAEREGDARYVFRPKPWLRWLGTIVLGLGGVFGLLVVPALLIAGGLQGLVAGLALTVPRSWWCATS